MALLQNGYRDFSSGVRIFGATASNNAYPYALHHNPFMTSTQRNLSDGEGVNSQLAGIPDGYRDRYSWHLPQTGGRISSRNEIEAVALLIGAGALGLNAESSITGEAVLSAVGQLVVSAIASITASGSVSGNIVAALEAVAALAGTGSLTATADALAWAVAAIEAQGSVSPTIYGTGTLAGDIEVSAQVGLTAVQIAEEVLDSQLVETGLSVRETLKLCLAALAGEVAISGNTVTIRSADDSVDRIIATTDTNGQRTAITLDVS
jgi:hypothetical protein